MRESGGASASDPRAPRRRTEADARRQSEGDFAGGLLDLGVRLPLRLSEEDVGVILDANGFDVLTVDVNNTIADTTANRIARLMVTMINVVAALCPRSR